MNLYAIMLKSPEHFIACMHFHAHLNDQHKFASRRNFQKASPSEAIQALYPIYGHELKYFVAKLKRMP